MMKPYFSLAAERPRFLQGTGTYSWRFGYGRRRRPTIVQLTAWQLKPWEEFYVNNHILRLGYKYYDNIFVVR